MSFKRTAKSVERPFYYDIETTYIVTRPTYNVDEVKERHIGRANDLLSCRYTLFTHSEWLLFDQGMFSEMVKGVNINSLCTSGRSKLYFNSVQMIWIYTVYFVIIYHKSQKLFSMVIVHIRQRREFHCSSCLAI